MWSNFSGKRYNPGKQLAKMLDFPLGVDEKSVVS